MKEAVRILHVINEMMLGGAESRIMDIYRNIDRQKVQFDFAVHSDTPAYFENEIRQNGGRIYVWPKFKLRTIFQYLRHVNRFFREHKEYQIVHGHLVSFGFVYQLLAKRNGVKIRIGHARTSSAEKSLKGFLKFLTVRPLKYCITHSFACSQKAGRFAYGKRSMLKGNVQIINNAIDARKFKFSPEMREQIRKEFEIGDKFVIGHVGSFRYAKNHPFLLDVFQEILRIRRDAVLLLVGEGSLKQKIIEKARKLGIIENVIFAGQRTDIPELLSAMDFFVFPSHYEGLPGAVVEAQAAGLRCLISDVISQEVGITELVNFMSLKEPAASWAKKVIQMAEYERKDYYQEIAAAGFDVKVLAGKMEEFYLRTIQGVHSNE